MATGEVVALVFGNERRGVSPGLLEAADASFYLPMAGFTQSFNISVPAPPPHRRLTATSPLPHRCLLLNPPPPLTRAVNPTLALARALARWPWP